MNSNSIKGNAAEYLVLHHLLKAGIPAWHTGGNNRRWDILIHIGPNRIRMASVKFAKTRLPIFTDRDEVASRGVYFIVVPVKKSDGWEVLMYDSKTIAEACIRYRDKAKKQKRFHRRPNFRNFGIREADYLKGRKTFTNFLKKYGKPLD